MSLSHNLGYVAHIRQESLTFALKIFQLLTEEKKEFLDYLTNPIHCHVKQYLLQCELSRLDSLPRGRGNVH